MTDQMDLTGYTPQEIEHLQRVEQKEALHQEIHWLADQLRGEAREIALTAIQRIAYLNHQGDAFETRAINGEALAAGWRASAESLESQRDLIADEYAEFIKSVEDGTNPIVREMMEAVRDGTHPAVREMLAEAHQAAFEEFQGNAGRLIALAQKLNKGA